MISTHKLPLTLYYFISPFVPNLSTFPFILLASTPLYLVHGLGDIDTVEDSIGCDSVYVTDLLSSLINTVRPISTHVRQIKYGCNFSPIKRQTSSCPLLWVWCTLNVFTNSIWQNWHCTSFKGTYSFYFLSLECPLGTLRYHISSLLTLRPPCRGHMYALQQTVLVESSLPAISTKAPGMWVRPPVLHTCLSTTKYQLVIPVNAT